jgi:deoxyribodipyrimidine photo-lyase
MIQPERIKNLNRKRIKKGNFVLYWMQQSQRVEFNHALEFAIIKSNELKLPLITFFGITDNFPEANERHYYFMLEGLNEVSGSLKERGIKMVIRYKSPQSSLIEFSKDASLIVVDRGYLKIQRLWRDFVANRIDCPLIQIESDVVVPVFETSIKEEYSARTIRTKIKKKLDYFLKPIDKCKVKIKSINMDFESFDIEDLVKTVKYLDLDRSVTKTNFFHGGTSNALMQLENFILYKLDKYPELSNNPVVDVLSNMSPYLHFGQISPLHIALKVIEKGGDGVDKYLEELIVRRELSMNFVYYNKNYDNFKCLPDWSKKTLIEHKKDRREYIYTLNDFENAKTHDPYWNAAQNEMIITGKMHGYMRMYWGKKILEWSKSPHEAFKIAIFLNNKYELDGRDPNGFAGVSWCFGKHDRAWKERKVFGKIRYMSAEGLKRKFDVDKYVEKINKLKND